MAAVQDGRGGADASAGDAGGVAAEDGVCVGGTGAVLVRLTARHAEALLAFERENRTYFAASVPDRGDAYFTEFTDRHRALLAEQAAGLCHFHLLLARDGAVLGRVNLVDAEAGSAELGYRIAEHATGRGLATAAVEAVSRLARTAYGLSELTAVTTTDNRASDAVLRRTGFRPVGPVDLGGLPGTRYVRSLGPRDGSPTQHADAELQLPGVEH